MNEEQTKHEYITPALKNAGWDIVEKSKIRLEYPITIGQMVGKNRRKKPKSADYVLQYNNRNLAVVEAKSADKYYTQGVGQAKEYAERLNIRFTYSTNGKQIYQIDMETGEEKEVFKYPSPQELWELTYPEPIDPVEADIAAWKERLFKTPFEDRGGTWQPRYYQENAINKVIEAVAEKKDKMLLTLATGTGKTAIAFQIAWKLFHAKWNLKRDGKRAPRILFLADRNILADQAFNSFNAFDEDALVRIRPEEIKKKGKVPTNGSIFFTIFQTFMSGPNDTPYFGDYEKDYFDFIIIDECHRGGASDESSWRAIMEYFEPAVQLGLTATPKRDINKDTYRYFGAPLYVYSLKQGINDGFLTPFKFKSISTTGDKYIYTSDDTVLEGEIEEGKEYTKDDMNKIIEIMDIERYKVQTFLKHANQDEKTLIFCASQMHAAAIRDLINQEIKSSNPNYCHRVGADDGKIGEKHLRDFQDNEKTIPTMLTTSVKLSTGVDAPEVRNIVLLRKVNSMVEFKQIVGRGTRLFDGKDYFTIYDFYDNHTKFQDADWDGEPQDPEPCKKCGKCPCECEATVCSVCGKNPCTCPKPEPKPCEKCGYAPCRCTHKPKMVRVKLSKGKVLDLDSMVQTSFWSPDGKPISSAEFVQELFKDLPSLFQNEEELRKIWSLPDTRKKLLNELNELGYSHSQLKELSKVVHGENSDLYDVLSYVAYHKDMIPRSERAQIAKSNFDQYNPRQREFLDFVLDQYIKSGVSELDDEKITAFITLKYHKLANAKKELGEVKEIRNTFIGFQKHLYSSPVQTSVTN